MGLLPRLGIAGNHRQSDVRQYGVVSAATAMPLFDADRIRADSPVREAAINFSPIRRASYQHPFLFREICVSEFGTVTGTRLVCK